VPGRIVKLSDSFAEGAFFTQDEVLLELDKGDLRQAEAQARVELSQAEIMLAREKVEAQIAVEEWKGEEEGPAPDLALRKPQLREARNKLEAARRKVEQAVLDVKKADISAPYDGRLVSRHVDLGQYVKVGDLIADIYAVDYAEVRLPIRQEDMRFLDLPGSILQGKAMQDSRLKELSEVVFRGTSTVEGSGWQGYLVRAEAEIDQKTRFLYVVARIPDPFNLKGSADREPLLPGTFVGAEIKGKEFESIVTLPRTALRPEDRVLVLDEENKAHYRKVKVVKKEKDNIFVSEGLESGERVVVSDVRLALEGMQVRVRGE